MDVVSLAEARRRLARLMDQAEANREPIVISRHGKQVAVTLSFADYNNLMEMVHLVRSPRNAARLRRWAHVADCNRNCEQACQIGVFLL